MIGKRRCRRLVPQVRQEMMGVRTSCDRREEISEKCDDNDLRSKREGSMQDATSVFDLGSRWLSGPLLRPGTQ